MCLLWNTWNHHLLIFTWRQRVLPGENKEKFLEESRLQQQGHDPSLQTWHLAGFMQWRQSVCSPFQVITKEAPLDCTVPLKLKTSKDFKIACARLCVHFSILELGDLSAFVCVLRLLICPRHLSCPAVLPASLRHGAERCCKVSMAALKRNHWPCSESWTESCQERTSYFCLRLSAATTLWLILWHGLFHLQIRYSTYRSLISNALIEKSNSPEKLLRILSLEEIIEEVMLKNKSMFWGPQE